MFNMWNYGQFDKVKLENLLLQLIYYDFLFWFQIILQIIWSNFIF